MAGPDQFAKSTFAEETVALTAGAVRWYPPPEIRLTHVHGDGALAVERPELLAHLPCPWREAGAQDEALVELKVNDDKIDTRAVERVLLRRQARQVELLEQAIEDKRPLPRQEGLWIVAPRVPRWLRDGFDVRQLAPGCYRIGPAWFQFLWIAANELPLQDELVPFLVVRSGLARDEFVLWVADRRPVEWVWNMLQYVKVTPKTLEELKQKFAPKEDPEDEARSQEVLRWMLDVRPAVKQELIEQGIEQGEILQARAALRRVLARRDLALDPEQEVRIDACDDLTILERWLDQAITAPSAAAALA